MLELAINFSLSQKEEWWILFAFIGMVCGFLPKEKVFYLKYLIFIACLLWTFVFLQIKYKGNFFTILFNLSVPQFISFIVPFRLADYYRKSESKQNKLEIEKSLRRKIQQEYKANYPKIESSDFKVIIGKEHLVERELALKTAKEWIYISSGWISSYVLDKTFLKDLQSLIDKKVFVRFIYGYEDVNGSHKSSNLAVKLLEEFEKKNEKRTFEGKKYFKVIVRPNHSKVLIVDGKYAICGSFNWLSNNIANNEEYSFKTEDYDLIDELKLKLKLLVNKS